MAITLTGSGGLFTRLGKIFKFNVGISTHQATTIVNRVEEVMAAFDTLRLPVASVRPSQLGNKQGAGNIFPVLQQAAIDTLMAMVLADKPARAGSLASSIQEVITQMVAASSTVKACTIASSASAISGSSGTGVVVVTTKRGDGLVQENAVAEASPLVCTSDSQTGGATEGQEEFTYTGEIDDADRTVDDWPTGSGATTTVTAIPADQDATAGNLLTNSDFEDWTGSPVEADFWELIVGTWGTDAKREDTVVYDGSYSLELVGDSATATEFRQKFADATLGTGGELLPLRSYALNFWAKCDVVPADGELTVELQDGDGNVIADAKSVTSATAFDVTGFSTSWVAKNMVVRMPKLIPDEVYLVFRLSDPITTGSSLFIDNLAMGLVTGLYDGGPGVAIFSGATRFVTDDGWMITTTNNRGGATYLATFQAMFDKFFGTRSLGLLLPTDASPSIADTLITA